MQDMGWTEITWECSVETHEHDDASTLTTAVTSDLISAQCQSKLTLRLVVPTKDSTEFKDKLLSVIADFKDK